MTILYLIDMGSESQFINSLRKDPETRSLKDSEVIHAHLRGMDALSFYRDTEIRNLSRYIRYEYHDANDILYCRGEIITSWFILLSGSVFIDGSMFLPRSSFGKRVNGSARRANECLILEPSEMLVIDYPDVQLPRAPGSRRPCYSMNLGKLLAPAQDDASFISTDGSFESDQLSLDYHAHTTKLVHLHRTEMYLKSNRNSHGSDTSSAYSGSDTMQSVHSSSLEDQEVDLTGLIESAVDTDEEEDLAESIDSLTVRDTARECLEKYPQERTEDDIETLLEFMQHLPAFANMTLAVRRALCAVMVFAVVEKAGTVVMNDGEELDSWSVIVNGHVEVEHANGDVQELHMGDSFGITPTMEKLYHKGVMRTKVDDCQFVCITQNDYYKILHQGEENTRRHEEDGQIVLITEHRVLDGGNRHGHIVIRGTPERLLSQLVEENSVIDPTYVEDFLLVHRTFIDSPLKVADKLLTWFEDPGLKDRVTRVVLLWVNNHFTDFETDAEMMEFLEKFETGLEKEKMQGQLRLLNIACATKARSRTVTLARSTRDEVLHFSILGGYERGFSIFVSKVEKNSKAEEVGLKRGDEILEVNGHSFTHMSHARALDILRGTTHLCITVKSNFLVFKEMLATPENSPRSRTRKTSEIAILQADPKARLSAHMNFSNDNTSVISSNITTTTTTKADKKPERKGFMTLGHKTKLKKALMKINIISKNGNSNETQLNSSDDNLYLGQTGNSTNRSPYHPGSLYHSHSNPDLSSLQGYYDADIRPDYPEHVLKVYRSDQTCKYLLVHKETTAREVVMLSLREFGITDPSNNYSLCEVTVGEGGVIKQRRLPDQLQNLAERIGLSSRYYLKNNNSTETLVPDELAGELMRENQVCFLQLNCVEVAVQLTLEDFSILRQIEPTEYIDDLFQLNSKYGTPMLSQFGELVNKEMFWVVSEVCSDHNLMRRVKSIKHFIKVARQCKECKNFNSMFAIISGLGHGAVSRLRCTWEKLPSKYQKMYDDMLDLMDPSRNMSKYRNLINCEQVQPPIIPFYPVVRKDLTFIHLGNDTKVESLINFEKLRMIAKEIRQLTNMCSAPYDLFTMLELGGAHPSAAMVSMNQLKVSGANTTTFKRRKKSTGLPNPKKMFEEAQMVRRVKAYLSNLKVITNEEILHQMSNECEPLTGTGNATATVANCSNSSGSIGSHPQPVAVRKRHPSPTLSTASSTSSTSEGKKSSNSGPKFGIDSPQAVRKILSLSEQSKIRPYQPPRASNPASLSPNAPRRRQDRLGHGRSNSDTTPPTVQPVDLSAESSSVTSLNNMPLRLAGSSDTSSVSSFQVQSHMNGIDSELYSQCDSRSISSAGSTNSPPHQRRFKTSG
ncbi:hypothetical protein CHUAL_002370 [Chamberlinius hualienensis]